MVAGGAGKTPVVIALVQHLQHRGLRPGAMFADVYALLWELHKKGDDQKLREVFSKLLLMINLDQQIPGVRNYVFQKRGIFKTTVSRRGEYTWTDAEKAEIDWNGRWLGEQAAAWVAQHKPADGAETEFAREFGEKIVEALGDEIDRIEKELTQKVPGLKYLDFETD